jgi:hypothetical protein
MVFNATFHNISVISWWSVLLMEETRVSGENHRPAASHGQTWSHIHGHTKKPPGTGNNAHCIGILFKSNFCRNYNGHRVRTGHGILEKSWIFYIYHDWCLVSSTSKGNSYDRNRENLFILDVWIHLIKITAQIIIFHDYSRTFR